VTNIPESNIDRHIDRVVKYVDSSDLGLKFACIAASAVVGTYDGTTQEIAKRTRRSVSTVENWAHAHWMYSAARKINIKVARALWRTLPPTHFWKAWDIHQAGYDALYYLCGASEYNWSAQGMMAEWDKERVAGHAPLQLSRAKLSFFGLASELCKRGGELTAKQNAAVDAVLKEFAE
jgi:hypothetical protein